jgi:iron-sulfur cluster repair protein YtfE (RIC family)
MADAATQREGHTPLHTGLTLNEILARHPEAGALLNELGFDTCCGGARTLEEAATALALDAAEVVRRILEAGRRRAMR